MADDIVAVYKPPLVTPLQTIELYRQTDPDLLHEVKITYAGRLDPLAEGVMILLCGGAIRQKEAFLALNKTYQFEILLGMSSDSYDLLGMPRYHKSFVNQFLAYMRASEELALIKGSIKQPYPPFSGKAINGIKLFDWYKAGKMPDEWPSVMGEILSVRTLGFRSETMGNVIEKAVGIASHVEGDFRQAEVIRAWRYLQKLKSKKVVLVQAEVSCTSGIFVRSICHELGKKLGCGALAYSIQRTYVGGYGIEDCIGLRP